MDGVIPARNGNAPVRYTWDSEGVVRNVEPLENVRARTEGLSSHGRHTARDSRSRVNWPFHHRSGSEAPSTAYTASHFSHFRRATAQTKSWFKDAGDSASVLSKSLVPDYVVHYMRGETPESLARKREQMGWGEKNIVLTPQRERFRSQQAFFEDPFGSRAHLAGDYFGQPQHQEGLGRFMVGWRGGVAVNAVLALMTLLVAVMCFAVASAKSKVFGAEVTVLSGSCSTVSSYNIGLHALINVLSVTLLAGGNYVFQLISSPTRDELTEAHDRKRWLDIGIPSIRNLPHISGLRTVLAAIIVLAVVATQVIYNAVIFTKQTADDTCHLKVSGMLFGIVALLNLITFCSIVAVVSWSNFKPLATLGDFISSFLRVPDATTKDNCLLTKADVKTGSWGFSEARYFRPSAHLWLMTPSALRWLLMVFAWISLVAPTAAALGLFLPADAAGISTSFDVARGTSFTVTAEQEQILAVGFSTQALVALLALLGALMMLVLGLGFRSAPGSALVNGQEKGNPLALKGGSCSAALSAKCHPAAAEYEPWTQELTWGVVADGLGLQDSCCGFSALSVGAVDVGRAYA
ncbi:hypothetical protein LQW54_013473 [Pestalotiopsis sp. IQ-011]